jgi:hypothetical protein
LRLLTQLLTQIERVLDNKKTYRGRNAQILVSSPVSRCTQIPESRSFVFNPFPEFNCIVAALKSRTVWCAPQL